MFLISRKATYMSIKNSKLYHLVDKTVQILECFACCMPVFICEIGLRVSNLQNIVILLWN